MSKRFLSMGRQFMLMLAIVVSTATVSGQTLTISSASSSGSGWSLSGGILTVTANSTINVSDITNALSSGSLTIVGNTTNFVVTISTSLSSTASGSGLTIGSSTNTGNITLNGTISLAGSLSVYGGNVFAQQNITSTQSGADILLQATAYIDLAASQTIQTNNGDITFRANSGGTAVAVPNSTTGAITLNSGSSLLSTGGNITLGGNYAGTQGAGLYAASARTGGAPGILINNATLTAAGGNINIYGSCTTSYDDGIRLQASISTTGSGSIGLYGDAFGGYNGTNYFGGITFFNAASAIETENGNLTLSGVLTQSQSSNTGAINFYRSSGTPGQTRHINLLSKTGDIYLTADAGATSGFGIGQSSWGNVYFGSPASSAWTASGDVSLSYNEMVLAINNGFIVNTTGSVTYQPMTASFSAAQTFPPNSLHTLADNASSLTIGKPGNTANVTIGSAQTIAGPISIYGGYVNVNANLTSSATGDILIKSVASTNPSIWVQSGKTITKSGGTGTLTMQGDGRVSNSGSITTSGTGVLNVIFWSDFDNDNNDGGVSQHGTISTNGGHVWLGGSSSNGGSYTWNGLTVGDGPSIGTTGFNAHAMELYGDVTTSGGDFLAWAGSTVGSGGYAGIFNDGSGNFVSVGSGDIVLITDMFYGPSGAALYFTQSGGTFTLVPHEGSFRSTLNWNPLVTAYIGSSVDDYNFSTGDFDWLAIGEMNSIARMTIGYYNGMLNGGTPVEFTNSSNITFSTATTAAGAVELYGGTIAMNANLTTTSTANGNISINGTSISGTGNLALAAGRSATINVSSPSTYDGIVSGSGSGLTKAGAGMLTLSKDHTYTGGTTISGGDLQVGTGGSLVPGASGSIQSTSAVSVASGSKLILAPNENVTFANNVSGDGGVEIKGMSGAYYIANPPTIPFLSSSWVDIAASGTVLEVLTRITGGLQCGSTYASSATRVAGAYVKSYNATNNTATLQFQQFDGTNTLVVFARLQQSGAKVQISINTTPYSTGAATRSGNQLNTDMSTGATSRTLATTYTAGQIGISQVYMSGKVNFTGSLTYAGTTTLSNTLTSLTSPNTYSYTSKGTQEITDASSSFPGPIVNNGLVILNRSTPLTIAGDMSGTEDVLQVGAAVTLTGTNTHTGTTTIDLNKTLNVGSGGSVGSMTGNIVNYGALTFNRTGSSSYPGIISGSGSLTKSGAGDLTMNNLNTYSGATTINGGTLILERDVPASSSSGFSGAGALTIQPSSASFTSAVSWPIPGFPTVSSSIGGLTVGKASNTSSVTFSSATQASGPITIYGGTVTLGADLTTNTSGDISIYSDNSLVISGGHVRPRLRAFSGTCRTARASQLRSVIRSVT